MSEPADIRSGRKPPPPKPRSTPCRVPLRLYLPAFARFFGTDGLPLPPAANDD